MSAAAGDVGQPAGGDLGEEQAVHALAGREEARRRRRAAVAVRLLRGQQELRVRAQVQEIEQRRAQVALRRPLVEAEDRAQDHVERHALHLGMHGERPSRGPARPPRAAAMSRITAP